MRVYCSAVVAALMLAGSASAQQQAASFFTGVPASQIKLVPVDTSKAIIQSPAQSALTKNRFDFSALFNRNIVPSFPPKTGVSPLPPPSSFPSTSYKPFQTVNDPPFTIKWMFGGDKPSPFQPQKPFTPGTKPPVGPGS